MNSCLASCTYAAFCTPSQPVSLDAASVADMRLLLRRMWAILRAADGRAARSSAFWEVRWTNNTVQEVALAATKLIH